MFFLTKMTKLIPVEKAEDFLLARQFILSHETCSASLASLVRRKSDKIIFLKNEKGITGLLSLDSTVYHCIPDLSLVDAKVLKNELPYLQKKPVRCVSGEAVATDFLLEIFGQPLIKYPYKMMKYPLPSQKKICLPELSGGEEIIRASEHDMEVLHSLQKDYMKDEVAVPGRSITDAEVSLTLRQILKNQLCFVLFCDGEAVAKANTNAIGINCIQIGGVYTHPLYRRNGYAGAIVMTLCKRAWQAGKTPVLFVKEKNKPAFNLYQKLGFEECGRYEIAYY